MPMFVPETWTRPSSHGSRHHLLGSSQNMWQLLVHRRWFRNIPTPLSTYFDTTYHSLGSLFPSHFQALRRVWRHLRTPILELSPTCMSTPSSSSLGKQQTIELWGFEGQLSEIYIYMTLGYWPGKPHQILYCPGRWIEWQTQRANAANFGWKSFTVTSSRKSFSDCGRELLFMHRWLLSINSLEPPEVESSDPPWPAYHVLTRFVSAIRDMRVRTKPKPQISVSENHVISRAHINPIGSCFLSFFGLVSLRLSSPWCDGLQVQLAWANHTRGDQSEWHCARDHQYSVFRSGLRQGNGWFDQLDISGAAGYCCWAASLGVLRSRTRQSWGSLSINP